ncbi:hypothetical protein Lspi_2356 [Legionella spiritensis]|uniref:Uncharacterized protein n=2 Tax=Legionella spiritensis TaxID=452 RepID=A0A0W0YYN2_LEGSP|nr:hypothetical protein Lspi_2356 [Legionella spiritensis]SNV38742.1 Uncharacterised protein [Legionella spiritensis]
MRKSRFFGKGSGSQWDKLININSAMWSTRSTESRVLSKGYTPISIGGSKLDKNNVVVKLKTLRTSSLVARTMRDVEFDRQRRKWLKSPNQIVPLGLQGQAQLVSYDKENGTVDMEQTAKNYRGHHQPESSEHIGFGLSYSDEYTLYHLMTLVSGNSSIVLVDPTILPDTHKYHQSVSSGPIVYDPDGTPSIHTHENEITLQDVPSFLIAGAIRRVGRRVEIATNPFFIDVHNPETPREIVRKSQEATMAFLNLSTIDRTGSPIPGMGRISEQEISEIVTEVVALNMEVNLEILSMSGQEQDIYYSILQEMRQHQHKPSTTYHSIEVVEDTEQKKEGVDTGKEEISPEQEESGPKTKI